MSHTQHFDISQPMSDCMTFILRACYNRQISRGHNLSGKGSILC